MLTLSAATAAVSPQTIQLASDPDRTSQCLLALGLFDFLLVPSALQHL